MKLQHFLSVCFLGTFIIMLLIPGPCTATFTPTNNLIVENGGMTWEYDEYISGLDAVFFRDVVDRQTGNNDSFVNAWELLNMELKLREQMNESIEKKPDVKFNESSEAVKVLDIEFWLSDESLGRVRKSSPIENKASVTYSFEKEIGDNTSLWFLGTPDSEVTITLPEGLDSNRTEGLQNKTTIQKGKQMVLKGNFDSEGEITIWLSENQDFKATCPIYAGNDSKFLENKTIENKTVENKTIENGTLQAETGKEVKLPDITGIYSINSA